MPNGYCGKVLRVDLTNGVTSVETPDDSYYRMYLGGWGIIAHELLRNVPQGIDAFDPENAVIFAPGVATGTPIPGSGRHAVGAKSPLTGGFGAAEVGGFWGTELKRAGFDAVIIAGASETPVYLLIRDGEAEIHDATSLWGQETAAVQEAIRSEHDDEKIRVIQCGIAGENLVRYACVISDNNRAAGRTGIGAVMGSKKLRAVAVRGTGTVEISDPEGAKKLVQYVIGLREHWADFHEHGTGGGILGMQEVGRLPTRNFREGTFEGASKIAGTTMTEEYLVGRESCHACPIGCKRVTRVEGEYASDPVYGGPEYETLAALGSLCGVDRLDAVIHANQLCNAYGLDTISTGVTISWAMECCERGLLTAKDTGGIEPRFGDHAAMTQWVNAIAHREGFGDWLADGALRAAQRLGRGSEQFVVHTKGQEYPMHDPRWQFGLGIGYATSPTGADHMHNFHDSSVASAGGAMRLHPYGIFSDPVERTTLPPSKAVMAAAAIRARVLDNCVGICMFLPYGFGQMRDIIRSVTGWDATDVELLKAGERALAMARLYNAREGLTPEDDAPPPRFFEPLIQNGEEGAAIAEEEMRDAIRLYYDVQGWDHETGAPTRAKLLELSLDWTVDMLPDLRR